MSTRAYPAFLHDAPAPDAGFGAALRRHRLARRMSQLDLALACGVSARHLSFLESGRAQPSREMVLILGHGLMLPRGAQNALLAHAGFSPAFPASPLEAATVGPFLEMLRELIVRHEPFPALVCDRSWTIRDANPAAQRMLAPLQGSRGEMNIVRMLTETPEAPELIANYGEVIAEMLARIRLEALEAGGDPAFERLVQALEAALMRAPAPARGLRTPLAPLTLNAPGGQLKFLSTIAHFGTSEDVTIRDLRLELLFPADAYTRAVLYTAAAPTGSPK